MDHDWETKEGLDIPGQLRGSDLHQCRICRQILMTEVGRLPGDGDIQFPTALKPCERVVAEQVLES